MRVSISPKGSVNGISLTLPARLGEARDQALVAKLAQHDARQLELAVISARTPGELAPVADPGRIPVARDLGHLQPGDQALRLILRLVVRDRLQLRILAGIFLRQLLTTLV